MASPVTLQQDVIVSTGWHVHQSCNGLINMWPLQGAPRLSLYGSWDRLQPPTTLNWMDGWVSNPCFLDDNLMNSCGPFLISYFLAYLSHLCHTIFQIIKKMYIQFTDKDTPSK